MKVQLNASVKDLDGIELPNSNMGKITANMLVKSSRGDVVKYWEWALKLNKGDDLDLDKSDFETFKNFVKDHDELPIITKAQVLELLRASNKEE